MALWVSVARVGGPYSFGRSGEMTENATPSEGVKCRFTAKMAFEEVSCAHGHLWCMATVTAAIVVTVVVAMTVVTVVTAATVVAAVVTICDFIPEFHTKALLP